jgi:hypothetical protein
MARPKINNAVYILYLILNIFKPVYTYEKKPEAETACKATYYKK